MSTTQTYSEQELIHALKARDNAAFSYLYDHYAPALYTVILQIIGNNESAGDTLQEVFLNIWRRIESYDAARGRLFTWMLNIARNASIDSLRSRSHQNSLKNREITENVRNMADSRYSPDPDRIGIRDLLAGLKPEYRGLLELAYFSGYTQEEIAELEDLPLGTVKTRIRTALIQLRKMLK